MAEHPIMFSTEMIRAILDGRKTQTRRIIKPQPKFTPPPAGFGRYKKDDYWGWGWRKNKNDWFAGVTKEQLISDKGLLYSNRCPYGKVGDTLWVRETHARWSNEHDSIVYSDNPEYIKLGHDNKLLLEIAKKSQECSDLMEPIGHWEKVPSIFMPKWAARIFLEITNIRVERVQDISGWDARQEGIVPRSGGWCRDDFTQLWDSLNAKRGYGWDKNPWVWVIEFKRVT